MHSPYVTLCGDPANFVDPDGRAGIHLSDFDKETIFGFASVLAVGVAWIGIGKALQGASGISQVFQAVRGVLSAVSTISSGLSLMKSISSMSSKFGVGSEVTASWQNDLMGEIRSHSGVGMAFRGAGDGNSVPDMYHVKEGDNLGAIAKRFHVSVSELARWNGIEDINKISIGQLLIVSDPLKATYVSRDVLQTKKKLKTLQDITGFLSLSADAIKDLGGLENAQQLLESGKFEAIFNGQTRQWSARFYGNKYVDAQFVDASKNAFAAKAASNSSCFKVIKYGGLSLNIAGLFLTFTDMKLNGVNPQNSADGLFGVYAFIPGYGWIVSGVYYTIGVTIGWENAIKSYVETIRGFQESTGEKQLVPLMFKY